MILDVLPDVPRRPFAAPDVQVPRQMSAQHRPQHVERQRDGEQPRKGQMPAPPVGEAVARRDRRPAGKRSEEHTSELQSLMRTSYAVFCLQKKNTTSIQSLYKST